MSVDRNAAKELFLSALDKPTPADRARYLDQACAADAALRTRVEALLEAHESGSFPDFVALAADPDDQTLSAAITPNDATETNPGHADVDAPSLPFLSPPGQPGNLGRLDHYEILSVVGQGGMGIVLKALDETLDRIVAIKVLGSQYAANATARRRFIREAKAVAAITHEHVVAVHAVVDRVPYLVMQFVSGLSLQDRLDQKGPLELKAILRIGMQIASGLAAAHKLGIVHRDIKPSNILLENGVERVKITDFGLARAVDDASVTQSGVIAGTPMYMSPEQAHGQPVDPRSDLFSLGSVLYAMCTGHAPFRASGTMAVLKRVIEDTPRPIREMNPEIPEWLEAIIAKLHAKAQDERIQTAKEVAQLLEQHLAHLQHPSQVLMPAPVTVPRRPVRRPKRRSTGERVMITIGVTLAIVMPCAVAGPLALRFLHRGIPPDDPPTSSSPAKLSLSVFVDDPELRVQVLSESWHDNTDRGDLMKHDWEVPPGRYQVRAFRREKPDELVFQEWIALQPGDARTVRVHSSWRQLFNGTDLTGWKSFPADRTSWKVEDGILIGHGQPSHLFSDRGDFSNFHLRMETWVSKAGATGQFVHVPFEDPRILLSPHGDEKLHTVRLPSLYAKDAAPIDPAPPTYRPQALTVWGVGKQGSTWVRRVPEGEWFTQEIIVDGPNITMKSPGYSHAAYGVGKSSVPTQGHVALQLFDANSTIRIRKVEIKELTSDRSIAGEWDSRWGLVTLTHDPLKGNEQVVIGGRWDDGKGGRGRLEKAVYDPVKGTLLARFIDEEANDVGTADLRIVFGGKAIVGVRLTDSGAIGGWPMWRKGVRLPDRSTRSVAGVWESDRGRVVLEHGPIGTGERTEVTGYYEPEPGKRVDFVDARLIPDFSLLVFGTKDGARIGSAQLLLSLDGRTLTGSWADSHRQRGAWTMTRSKEKSPTTAFALTPPKLIEHMVGSWDVDISERWLPTMPAPTSQTGRTVIEPVAGGRFARIRSRTEHGEMDDLQILGFDPDRGEFRGMYFDPKGIVLGPAAGRFDAMTRTLTIANQPRDGVIRVQNTRFPDANSINWDVVFHDKAGKTALAREGKMRRRTVPSEIDESKSATGALPTEMSLLDRLIGPWDVEMTSLVRPRDKWKAEFTGRKVLGGRFIEVRERILPSGEENLSLSTYDPQKKAFRQWYVSSRWSSAEGQGTWDETTKTLSWACESPEITTLVVSRFVSADRTEFRITVKDRSGKLLEDLEGSQTRHGK